MLAAARASQRSPEGVLGWDLCGGDGCPRWSCRAEAVAGGIITHAMAVPGTGAKMNR